jgi:hypothetical protein
MANTTVITKLANGSILVEATGETYTRTPDSPLVLGDDKVSVLSKANGSLLDTFLVEDVEKVVRDTGVEIPITDAATLFNELSLFFFFKLNGGGNSPNLHHLGEFTNYTDLITQFPTPPDGIVGTLAYVIASQGTSWLPGSYGGNFYSKGTYAWTGTLWDSAVDDIAKAIEDLNNNLTSHVNDVANPHAVTKAQVGLGNVPNIDATQRANHTGTQLSSTISDFAATVRATVLTGISFATSAKITAADTILAAFGKTQAQLTLLDAKAHISYTGGTTDLVLTQNVWSSFPMTGATLEVGVDWEQLAGFPDTLVYKGLLPLTTVAISTSSLRRIGGVGGGADDFQLRWVKNGVQYGSITQFELAGLDVEVTMTNAPSVVFNDQLWIEIRNTEDADDVRLLNADLTI